MPHAKPLGDGLHELRTSGRDPQRLYYAFESDRVCILHHGTKHAQSTDVATARHRLADLRQRGYRMTTSFRKMLNEEIERDPEFARRWHESEASHQAALLLIRLRADLGLTQGELAERAGVKRSYIARIESGRANPTVETLARILASVGMTLDLHAEQAVA